MIRHLARRRRRDEKGMETVAMLFVIPVLVILVLALVDLGMMFRARMVVENIARDTVRAAAADGGMRNPRTSTLGTTWSEYGFARLYKNNRCQVGQCERGERPTMSCWYTDQNGTRYTGNTVRRAGHLVNCRVIYPYKGINEPLLNSPIGLGMGSLLKSFDITVSARSETGAESEFGTR